MSNKSDNRKLLKNKYVIAGIVAAVVVIMTTAAFAYGYALTVGDRVISGVCVADLDLSGKTAKEAAQLIRDSISVPEETAISFHCGDAEFDIPAVGIGLEADAEATAEAAVSYGRTDGIVSNAVDALRARFGKKHLDVIYKCDNGALMAAIEENLEDAIVPVTPYSVEIGDDCIIVRNGVGGKGIEQKDVEKLIVDDIKDGKIDNTIELTLTELSAEPIDFDEFCNTYLREPIDADYTETDGTYNFTKEVEGISFDKEQAKEIIELNRDNDRPYKIPAVISHPEVTVKDLQSKFASDCLSSYSTSFASSDANRAANVSLAASKINGVVLNPGERFSYNAIVGPRTVAAGFKIAHVYEGDSVVDGVGGGICQVSSTLYNAVLLADLKIVSRTNHSMPVGYVPLGRDATVSYGTIDFIFENDKNHPVKITATGNNRKLVVSVYGVAEGGRTVEIVTENAGYIPYPTKEIPDSSLKDGERKIVKNGSNGTIVNTYKVYKENGVQVEKKLTSKSSYIPITRVIKVGTAKPAEPVPPAVSPSEPESPPQDNQPQIPDDVSDIRPGEENNTDGTGSESDTKSENTADGSSSAQGDNPADGGLSKTGE